MNVDHPSTICDSWPNINGEYVVSIYMPAIRRCREPAEPRPLQEFAPRRRSENARPEDWPTGDPENVGLRARRCWTSHELWQNLSQRPGGVRLPRRARAIGHCRSPATKFAWSASMPICCRCWRGKRTTRPTFVLAVSQNAVRLLAGHACPDRRSRRARSAGQSRARPCTTTRGKAPCRCTPASREFAGKEGVVFHGQGGEVDVAKEELTAYFREIDRAVSDFLQLRTEPLIFAGVDYLFPIYQSVNSYPHLAATASRGNPDLLTPAGDCASGPGRWWKPVDARSRS